MGLKAHFLNQGRVDSVLIECDGMYAFIDGGYRSNGLKAITYLKNIGVEKLEFYVASHGHLNHIGAAAPIIEAFKPRYIYARRPEVFAAIKRYAKTSDEIVAFASAVKKIIIPHAVVTMLGGATIICVGPDKLKKCSCGAYGENYNSLILRVDYAGAKRILLTGDTSASIIAKCGNDARAEVLKNPHHSGRQPISLLRQVKPTIVVVLSNVRASSSYHKTISSTGATLYNACKTGDGRVIITLNESEWDVETSRKDGKQL